MMAVSGKRLEKLSASMNEEGSEICFHFELADGSTVEVEVGADMLQDLYLGIEEKAKEVNELRTNAVQGGDPRGFFPISVQKVTRIQSAIGADGSPVLSFEINGRMLLNLSLAAHSLRDLGTYLIALADSAGQAGPRMN
jgi:hypothetical protein